MSGHHHHSSLTSKVIAPIRLFFRLAYRTGSWVTYWLTGFIPFLAGNAFGGGSSTSSAGRSTTLTPSFSQTLAVHKRRRRLSNPEDIANRAAIEFGEQFGDSHPPFFRGSYAQAFRQAKAGHLLLLVILQSDEHDETGVFATDVLCNSDFDDFIRRNEILVWYGNVLDVEAYHASSSLQCSRFPFAALIGKAATRRTAVTSSTPMSVILRLEGVIDPIQVLASLSSAVTNVTPGLRRLRLELAEQEAARNIRADQDSAYEASLARDRARAEEAEQARLAKEAEDEKVKLREQEVQNLETKRRQWRRWRLAALKKRFPAFFTNDTSSGGEQQARISLRLASGERIVKRVSARATIEELYALVDTLNSEDDTEEIQTEPALYNHEYSFILVSPLPRFEIMSSTSVCMEEVPAIWPSGSIVVEEIA